MNGLATYVNVVTAFDIDVDTKEEAIKAVVHRLGQSGELQNEEEFVKDVFKREEELPTYIGYNFGLPHSRSKYVKNATIGIGRLNHPVHWTEDNEADFIFLIAVPDGDKENTHLKILAKLARLLMHKEFREELRSASESEVKDLLLKTQAS